MRCCPAFRSCWNFAQICNLDAILHTWSSKQEKSHCLHDDTPFPSLLAGLPGVLISLETTTCAFSLKRYRLQINFSLVSFKIITGILYVYICCKMRRHPHFKNNYWTMVTKISNWCSNKVYFIYIQFLYQYAIYWTSNSKCISTNCNELS